MVTKYDYLGAVCFIIIFIIVAFLIITFSSQKPSSSSKKKIQLLKEKEDIALKKKEAQKQLETQKQLESLLAERREEEERIFNIIQEHEKLKDEFAEFKNQQFNSQREIQKLSLFVEENSHSQTVVKGDSTITDIYNQIKFLREKQIVDNVNFCKMYEKIDCVDIKTCDISSHFNNKIHTIDQNLLKLEEDFKHQKTKNNSLLSSLCSSFHEVKESERENKNNFMTKNLIIDSTNSSSDSLIEFIDDNVDSDKNLFNFNHYCPSLHSTHEEDLSKSISTANHKTIFDNGTSLLLKCNVNTIIDGIRIKNEPYYIRLFKVI